MDLEAKPVFKKSLQNLKGFSGTALVLLFLSWLTYNVAWYILSGMGSGELIFKDIVLSVLLISTAFNGLLATGSALVRQYRSDTVFVKALSHEGPKKMFIITLMLALSSLTYFVSAHTLGFELLGLLAALLFVLAAFYQLHTMDNLVSKNKDWLTRKVGANKEELRPIFLRAIALIVLISVVFSVLTAAAPSELTRILADSLLFTLLSAWFITFLIQTLDELD